MAVPSASIPAPWFGTTPSRAFRLALRQRAAPCVPSGVAAKQEVAFFARFDYEVPMAGSLVSILKRCWPPALVVFCILLACAAHAPVLVSARYASVDEAYASAMASRLDDGFRLYEGAVSQRGPFLYGAFWGIARLASWHAVAPIRVAALLTLLGLMAAVFWAARRLACSWAEAAIAVAVVTYAIALAITPYDGLALHGELLMTPLLVCAAVWGLPVQQDAPWRARVLAAGTTIGIAVCIKQTAAANALPIVAVLLQSARRDGWVRACKRLIAFAGTAALAPALVVLEAWRAGTLRPLVYYTVTYNATVHARGMPFSTHLRLLFERLLDTPLFLVAAIAGLACALRWRDERRIGLYVAAHFLASAAMGATIPQQYSHYYIPSFAFLALLLGGGVGRVLLGARWTPSQGGIIAAGIALVGASGMATAWSRLMAHGRVAHGSAVEKTAARIAEETREGDRIFVWGFSPWLYGYSARRPAGRFVFSTYVTGFVPWVWDRAADEPAHVVPGSVDELLGDLERERPAMVVDAGTVQMGRSMRAYPVFADWLHRNYCFAWRLGAFDIYSQKPAGTSCPAACFPKLPPPVDYFDAPMGIWTAPAVDDASSRWLPPGDYFAPLHMPPERCGQ